MYGELELANIAIYGYLRVVIPIAVKFYLLQNSLFDRISVPNVLQIVAPKING